MPCRPTQPLLNITMNTALEEWLQRKPNLVTLHLYWYQPIIAQLERPYHLPWLLTFHTHCDVHIQTNLSAARLGLRSIVTEVQVSLSMDTYSVYNTSKTYV